MKGRKKGESISIKAVERKNRVFQPLIDELEKQAYGKWGISEKLEVPMLDECVINSYKYAFDESLKQSLQQLYNLHCEFNNINALAVVHRVIEKIFEMGYEKLYGSIIDGVVSREVADGEYIDEEIILLSQSIVQELKERIEKIVKIYEVEQI